MRGEVGLIAVEGQFLRKKFDVFSMQKDGWGSYRETLAQTRDGGPEEDYVHALPASGSPVFREIRHGGGLHRSDDEARAEGQLDLQTYRQVANFSFFFFPRISLRSRFVSR